MTKYQKYTWVCTGDCDALIEYTYKDGFGWPNGVMQITCPCNSTCTLLSVEDATIPYTDTQLPTKEETMEETTVGTINDLLTPYQPDMLVTYKKISGYSDTEFLTDKVRNIEWELHNARTNSKIASALTNRISLVKDIIVEAYSDSDDQETLRSIAEALEIELTRDVEWSATIEVSGVIQLDLLADSDTDIESEIYDNLYVESQNGNIEITDTEVCNVREN
jgi:hypothetical protein